MGSKIIKAIPPYQPTAVALMVIIYLTLLPQPLGEEHLQLFDGADKVVHFMMFGGLTATYIFDRRRTGLKTTLSRALSAALCATCLGALIEYLQYAMALGRSGNDIYDALANMTGTFSAVIICVLLHWVDITIHHSSR